MKLKRSIIVSLFLLAIMTLGAVSAEDLTANETQDLQELSVDDTCIIADDSGDGDDEIPEEEPEDNPNDENIWYEVNIPSKINTNEMDNPLLDCWFEDGTSGNLTVAVEGKVYYNNPVIDGEYLYFTPDDLGLDTLKAGETYKVNVHYTGDGTHEPFTVESSVLGDYKFRITDEYFGESIPYGNNIYLFATLPEQAAGNLVYTCNGKKISVPASQLNCNEEGGENLIISGDMLKCGDNLITFSYVGDDYPEKTINLSFYMYAPIILENNEVTYDENAYFTLTLPSDAKGSLNVYELKIKYEEDIYENIGEFTLLKSQKLENGFANVSVSGLSFGRHYIYANYTGDDYTAVFDIGEESLSEQIDMDIYSRRIYVNPKVSMPHTVGTKEKNTATVQFPENFNADLSVSIGAEEKTFALKNGVATFDIFNMESARSEDGDGYGTLYVNLHYDDEKGHYWDEYYYLTVTDRSPDDFDYNIKIYEDVVFPASDIDMEFDSPVYCQGTLNIYVDGKYVKSYKITNDYENVYVPCENLSLGKHDILFNYVDDYYSPVNKTIPFTISNILINVPDELYTTSFEHIPTIDVTIYEEAEGNVSVLIDGAEVDKGKINDGYFSCSIPELGKGTHTYEVKYANGNHPNYSENGTFEVFYDYYVDDLISGQTAEAAAYYSAGATGEVTLTVAGKKFTSTIDENGKANFEISGIDAGEYEAVFSYAGDKTHPGDTKSVNFTSKYGIISNVEDTIKIDELDKNYFYLQLPKGAEGNLVVCRENYDDENAEILCAKSVCDGFANITFADLNLSDKYATDLKIYYDGNDYNIGREYVYNIIITNYKLTRDSDDYTYIGESETYTLELLDKENGKANIFDMDTKKLFGTADIINGKATISLTFSKFGSYHYLIKYKSDKYNIRKYLYIIPYPQNYSAPDSIVIGEDDIIEVTLPVDASGNITVYLSNENNGETVNFTSAYTGGKAAVPSSDLNAGKWMIRYFTLDDEKYGTFTFQITPQFMGLGFLKENIVATEPDKEDPGLKAEISSVNAGDDAVVIIEINKNVTGKVTVDGAEVAISEGKGTYTIAKPALGNHTVTVAFTGDRYFNASEITAAFSVKKVEIPTEDLFGNDTDKTDSKNPTYTIKLPSDATGNLTVTVGNRTYTKELVNGSATIEVDDLPAGSYEAKVSYSGDTKYSAVSKTEKATVKVDPKITASDLSVQYSAGKYFKVTVYGDDGKVAANKNVVFKVNGKVFKKVTTDKNGVAKFKVTQTPKKHTITAEALGTSATAKLTVKQILTLKKVTVKKSAKKLVLTATIKKVNGKYIKNKKVTFKFNGKKYTAKTNKKGVAKVTLKSKVLKKLKVGKKVTYQVTYLKDTVKKSVKVKK